MKNEIFQQPAISELLTVEQFAERLQVSRTTVFEWLKTGNLEQGKHYFKIGRVLRFVWDVTLLLLDKRKKHSPRRMVAPLPSRPKDHRRQCATSQPQVNLDY
jgi:excisionase family DNA binding protein